MRNDPSVLYWKPNEGVLESICKNNIKFKYFLQYSFNIWYFGKCETNTKTGQLNNATQVRQLNSTGQNI